jgi:hypothetical protein
MSDHPRGYQRDLSSFGGLPIATIQGVSSYAAAALMRVGIHDAEHLIALAAMPDIKPYVARQLGGSDADLESLVETVQRALPPAFAAAAAAPVKVTFALGALQPTPAIEAEIAAVTMQMPPAAAAAAAAALPPSVNYAALMPPIRNQGARGTCVAFAMTAVHEFHRKSAGLDEDFSEQFLYHETKLIDGVPDACGTWNVKAAQILSSLGECREIVWGYSGVYPCNNNGARPGSARQDAAGFRLQTIVLPRNDITAIKSALAGGALVAFSIPVYNSWIGNAYTTETGLINLPLAGEISNSGHAMCLIGYQDNPAAPGGGYFILRNSWDTTWGYQCPYGAGNGTISYQYITDYCWEAVTAGASAPAPTPTPPPRPFFPWWPFQQADVQGETGARPSITIDTQGRFDIVIR